MSTIKELNREVMEACRLYVDNLIKPIHSLGKLEDMAIRLSGILSDPKPKSLSKAVVIFAGDGDVDGENTTKGKRSLEEIGYVASGNAPVSAICRQMGMPVYVIDAGLEQETDQIPGVLQGKVIHGTHHGHPAMDREVSQAAISLGMSVGKRLAAQGVQAVGLGNIGERAMLSALAVTASIMKEELEQASARGGYSLSLGRKADFAKDPLGAFADTGSAEIAALYGLVVECGRKGMAVVFDNAVTGAAVLAACETYPELKEFIFPSVAYDEPVHAMQMQKLSIHGFLHYDISTAEGFGSALGLSLLDASLAMLNEMKTFGTGNVPVAVDGPGKGRQREDVK